LGRNRRYHAPQQVARASWQLGSMRTLWPGLHARVVRRGIVWVGTLQPTEASPEYSVEIALEDGGLPRVYVRHPAIRDNAPHRFVDTPRKPLCLYWHKEWQWDGKKLLAETIVPWTALWLRLYELWLVTGEWYWKESPHRGRKAMS